MRWEFNTILFLYFSILLHHGAPVDCIDVRGYTPMFWASRIGSLSNIIELIDHGADVNHVAKNDSYNKEGHVFHKTPLFRARTYDTVKLLLTIGADPNMPAETRKHGRLYPVTAIEHLMQYDPECTRAILDECLSKKENDLVMNFYVFGKHDTNETQEETDIGDSNEEDNEDDAPPMDHEMSVFKSAKKYDRTNIILHPLMQIFLYLKYDNINGLVFLRRIYQIIFLVTLTFIAVRYAELTHCTITDDEPCFEIRLPPAHLKWAGYRPGYVIGCHIIGQNNSIFFKNPEIQNSTAANIKRCDSDQFMADQLECKINETHIIKWSNESQYNGKHPLQCEKNNLKVFPGENGISTSFPFPICDALGYEDSNCWPNIGYVILAYILLALLACKELCEVFRRGISWSKIVPYFKNLENYLQIFLLVCAFLFMHYSKNNVDTALHFGAWMVFVIWIDTTLLMGRISKFGLYIYMSVEVTKTMLMCYLTYFPTFMAFTFGMHILYKSNPGFEDYKDAFFR